MPIKECSSATKASLDMSATDEQGTDLGTIWTPSFTVHNDRMFLVLVIDLLLLHKHRVLAYAQCWSAKNSFLASECNNLQLTKLDAAAKIRFECW